MPELIKREGGSEDFDCAKLARSIRQAGVPVYSVSAMVARACVLPVRDTNELRRRVEKELARRYPAAARNYVSTRRWRAVASDAVRPGQAGLNPATAARIGIEHGETIRVEFGRSTVTLDANFLPGLAQDHVWLSNADFARAGIGPAARVTVGRIGSAEPPAPDAQPDAATVSLSRPELFASV